MINISICLSDIPEDKRQKARNGKWYANFTIDERKEPDQYGNTHSVSIQQSKEERSEKLPKTYVGNGKEYVFERRENEHTQVPNESDPSDDLPFN